MKPGFSFNPRWKEELVCETPWATFVVEITMGKLHVYFPDEQKWMRITAGELQGHWHDIIGELKQWGAAQGIPVSFDSEAWLQLEKTNSA